jgi:hypothetical protein
MDSKIIYDKHGHAVTFVGADAVALYRAAAIASALRFYAKTGMKVNTAYTPTNMLKAATGITGKAYKRGQYTQAAADLSVWVETMKAALPHEEG